MEINKEYKNKIGITTIEVSGFKGALYGMRAPMQSYHLSDTVYEGNNPIPKEIGEKDRNLAIRLKRGGTEDRKYLRMIHVQASVSLPRYIWSELDTYKVATVSDSESTMHKLLNNANPITEEQFYFGSDPMSTEYWLAKDEVYNQIEKLEILRKLYQRDKKTGSEEERRKIREKNALDDYELNVYGDFVEEADSLNNLEKLKLAKRILPECFIQTRVWDANYETLMNIERQRKTHRLQEEWKDVFVEWIHTLPYYDVFLKND